MGSRSRVNALRARCWRVTTLVETETPTITRSTPRERATPWCRPTAPRFVLRPYRVSQLFKQLLMVAGWLHQIACRYRRRDPRRPASLNYPARYGDGASSTPPEDIIAISEGVLTELWAP